ncbi:FHA domain-containing protein [Streptomyces actuosus]|uniref:FHA domain-containing protein n=1 Tax=Streptomyces actuosus TaxID=1885 RepID=A0ABS2VTK0_STRAS|nr:FHA domain-containing protein [Streptomyces actuosus]MBN0046370.1 FHA domain-containing protein [Streptomyces actuosus]
MPTCPNGHQSGSDDWCEVCGHRMAGAVPPPPPPPPTAGGGYGFPPPAPGAGGRPSAASQHEPELCPQCRTPREGGAPFCEECRWNFLTNTATSYTPAAPRPSAPAPGPRFPQGPGQQGPGPSYGAGDPFDYQSSRPSQVNRPAEPIPPSPFGAEPSGRAGAPVPGGQGGPGGQPTAGGPGAFPGAGGPGGPNGPSGPPAFGGSGHPGAPAGPGGFDGPAGPGGPGGHAGQGGHAGPGGHSGHGGQAGQGGPSGPSVFGAAPSRPVPPPPGPTPPPGPQATSGAPQAFMPPGPSGPGGMNGPSAPSSPSGFPQESGRPGPPGPAFGGGDDDWVISPPSHTSGGHGGPGGQGGPGGYGYPQPGATQAPPAPGPAFPQQGQPPQPATWTATIGPDREYFMAMMQRSGPEAAGLNLPAYSPEQQRTLTGNQVTIGRRRHSTGEIPDIDLSVPPEDPGVSHQHAVLVQQPDGNWAVVDQNSTNGTTVNGGEEPIQPFVPVPLQDGDRVHVGAWTTITVRRG